MCVWLYVCMRGGGQCLPRLLSFYMCLMAYECFHGNNDSLSWLDGLTYRQAEEGKQSSGDRIWLWGDFYFISAQQEVSMV